MNKSLYFLLFSISFTFGMRNTIAPIHQKAILLAATLDEAADNFNRLVASEAIAPTVTNTRWCIYTLLDKASHYNLLDLAQKLNPPLASMWLSEYLDTQSGFLHASTSLKNALALNNKPLIAFLLSTRNSSLANSLPLCQDPSNFMIALSESPEILQHFLQAGLTCDILPSGWGYIHSAAYYGYPQLISILLAHGTEVDLPSEERVSLGDTPLIMLAKTHTALHQSHLQAAQILLEHGADTKVLSKQEQRKPSELADPTNVGGVRGQLKALIQFYEHPHKMA